MQYPSECWAVHIAVHGPITEELCMVEGIEGFEAQLQRLSFGEPRHFTQHGVEIFNARSIEEAARRSTGSAERIGLEQAGVERRKPISRIVIDFQRPRRDIRDINADRVDTVVL